ncbi:MAG: CapA family protein [Cellulomonadaceae bacterium]|jgi:poly-gamma-glutamate synthesis protein (capsule biosynthesis protein)|nr:CapA family protein [Cellulomonadaceae bacterium]
MTPLYGGGQKDVKGVTGMVQRGTRVIMAASMTVFMVVTGMMAGARPAAADGREVGGSGTEYYFSSSPVKKRSVGKTADRAYVGDWDGDGKDTVMIRRGNTYFVRNALNGPVVKTFTWGTAKDVVYAGDWDGDGKDTLMIRRGIEFYGNNSLRGGAVSKADIRFSWGTMYDEFLVGDWNGDGKDTVALRRGTTFIIRNKNSGKAAYRFTHGKKNDAVVVGDWDGDGKDTVALRRGNTYYFSNTAKGGKVGAEKYGRVGDAVMAGDWNGDGQDSLGLRRCTGKHCEAARKGRMTVLAAGDVLIHTAIVNKARTRGGYSFTPMLRPIDSWVQGADLALCNMETPLVPRGQALSSFPVFGVPREIARDLAAQGWDGCSTATNHSLDRGWAGVTTTIGEFRKHGLGYHGTAGSAAEAREPQMYRLERLGRTITVAHIAMTWSTNGIHKPAGRPYAVQMANASWAISQARAARMAGADVVLVSLHAGIEYTQALNPTQKSVPSALARSGLVDLVIGHHPHVPQRISRLAGGPGGKGMFVAYSLGNMFSAMVEKERTTGLFLTAEFDARAGKPVRVAQVNWTATSLDRPGYTVHAVTTGYTGAHGSRRAYARSVVGKAARERTTSPRMTGPVAEVVPR